MTHYVCSECGSESKLASTCDNDDCVRQGMTRNSCNCEDGKHDGVINHWNAPESETAKTTEDSGIEPQQGTSENVLDLDSGEDAG